MRASGRTPEALLVVRLRVRPSACRQTNRSQGDGMIVVMKPGSSKQQADHVNSLVREMGLKEHVIVGTERTVVACIGNDRYKDKSRVETVDGGERVVPILAPYKMASAEVKKDRTVVPLGGRRGGSIGGTKVGVIAGPCSVED